MYGLDLLALALTLQSPILYAPLCKRQVQVVMDFWSSPIDSHDTQGNGYSNLLAAGLTDALAVLIANWDMTVAKRKDLSLYLKIAVFGLILTTQGQFLGPSSVLRFADSSVPCYANLCRANIYFVFSSYPSPRYHYHYRFSLSIWSLT